MIWPNPLLQLRLLAVRLLIVASISLLAACEGNVTWHATPDYPPPLGTGAGAPGVTPGATPTPAVDYVPPCQPWDPPGAYCTPPQ